MRTSPVLLLLVLCVALVFARTSERDKYSGYSMVRVFANGPEDLRLLQEHGIDIDHYRGEPGSFIELVINQNELEQLRATGIALQVVVDDLDAYYDRRRSPKEQELAASRSILELNGVSGFEYGSMGGFYTYAEVVRELDSMKLQYPNLITEKDSIGVTEQGRTVWAVEISDNPGQNEPDEAVAYYDALHHAREPMSMAVLMYYMYWLLDNYGTDPEATYLVNNRRMLFVPVVNPDGYVHNQTTNPNGGGNWRKNRRNNGGGIYGVDLNRNYGYQWGYDNIGSSPSPSSDTYRGPSAYSEPESRAVRDFTAQHLPSVAFSTHSVAGRYLNPYSYKDTVISYEYYAEFASDFSRNNGYLYGTVYQMLSYNSNGTTRDYLHHDLNCFSWTPEFGGSGFWPNQSEIVPVVQENLLPCKYLSWVGGAFADYQAFRLIGNQYALRGDTLRIAIDVRNKGLTLDAISVNVSLQSLYPQATVVVGSVPFGSMSPRQAASNDVNPFVVAVAVGAQHLDEMKFIATVTQEGIVTSVDTFSIVVGFPKVLFQDDGESGIGSWTRGGNQIQWDTTSVMAYLGSTSFADSRYGNVANSTNNSLATTSPIALAGSVNPRLEYFARWSNEAGFDYARIQISTNNGTTWTNLTGRHTVLVGGQPSYTGNKGTWAWEQISLASYSGQQVRFRFNLVTDSGLRGDGFYFDQFRVVDYRDTVLTAAGESPLASFKYALDQNYPNPFNPATNIRFTIELRGQTALNIFDVLGRHVATVVNEVLEPGEYERAFDASNLSSGIYFYRLESNGFNKSQKMIVLR